MAVPYTFGSATSSIPLSQLDSNFATTITLGNTAIQLGNTVTTLNNMTLANVSVTQATFTSNVVVSVTDNTNAALRITQLGTGNALLVEDSTNPDSTPFVIDASGTVIQGYTSALTVADYVGVSRTPRIQEAGLGGSPSQAYISSWSNSDTTAAGIIFGKSKSGTVGTAGAVTSGTDIGFIQFSGDDGTSMIPAAVILAEVDGTPGTNDMPGRLVFSTTADGASAVTERMRIDSSGNVGIGTSSPSKRLSLRTSSADVGMSFGTGANAFNQDIDFFNSADSMSGRIRYYPDGGFMSLWTAGSERMRIDSSGSLLVGGTTTSTSFAVIKGATYGELYTRTNHPTSTPSGFGYADFLYNGSGIGSISQNGTTGVLYNLTSDYRLKNNPVALTGAKDFVMALQPKKWQWWDGSGEGVGFIAHEFMEVAKYSGNGTKDAVETIEIKDEQGNVTGTEQRPIMQSIQPSSSEVMANLVAFIQEQQATITALTARIVALEAK